MTLLLAGLLAVGLFLLILSAVLTCRHLDRKDQS
jgi:hypothetical protein